MSRRENKRVLVHPNERKSANNKRNKRQIVRRNNRQVSRNRNNRRRQTRKRSGKTFWLVIIALVAFVIGAGVGVSLSLDEGADEEPHIENVTVEMTSNLNETDKVIYDEEIDNVDYNNAETLAELNITQEPTYY